MRVRILTAMLLGALCAVPHSGCRQKEGERCQIDSDCENSDDLQEGLYCELGGNPISVGGICKSRKPSADMAVQSVDLAQTEVEDLAMTPDLTGTDLGDMGPADGGG